MTRLLSAVLLAVSVIPTSIALAKPKPPKDIHVTRATVRGSESEEERERERAQRVTARVDRARKQLAPSDDKSAAGKQKVRIGPPIERHLKKAKGKNFDLRALPSTPPRNRERPEREVPPHPVLAEREAGTSPDVTSDFLREPVITAAAPAPILTFEGLDRQNWGAGSPPDTNGDAGPTYYIQSVNTSVGVYRKSDGFREAAFTFDTLMSQGDFGNLCDTDNFGDPVVLYDTFEDRWILTDFAFQLDINDNVSPPVAYQCFAVSMTGNPVSGGWNFYSIELTDGLNDYPKLGIWPDGLYMTANMFDFAASGGFQGVRVWALNKAQMYAGSPTVKIVSFDLGDADFTVIPSNARLQTGTPPIGRPNLFVSTWNFLNALSVYKFHVDWTSLGLSTFTGPDVPLAATSWPNADLPLIPQQGTAMTLDSLEIRAMVQNQYTNIGGVESLWVPHSVRRGNTSGFAAPRWYQANVTGGTVAANLLQAATWDPDAANVMHRFMPSLALDRAGNLALGYSTSSSTSFPSIKYAGRLAADPVNTFSQTEQLMLAGTASQTGTERWGDYSSMTLDPDGCTFWYTTEYANPASQASNMRWKTRIGAFKYPSCTVVGAGGTVSGTVTAAAGGTPIGGATVDLGARSTTTNASGVYSFTGIPAGTYPSISASYPGYVSGSSSNVVVTDGGTTVRNFSLTATAASACTTDTSQADFQSGEGTNVDLTTSPGDVKLDTPVVVDQATTGFTSNGTGFDNVTFAGQTFTPGVSGLLKRLDINIFCASCSGADPNLILEVRTVSAGNITMTAPALLATSTIAGTSDGFGGYMAFNFASPATLTSGTQYGFVLRIASARTGTQAVLFSDASGLANGRRQTCSSASCANSAGTSNDIVFISYMSAGFASSGTLMSSVKDSAPAVGFSPVWTSLAWNAVVPANTAVRFQIAASASVNGPFSFVGPDGTAGTFFTTSPASLTQFNGFRYLRYSANLTTTNSAATPTLQDVTICSNSAACGGAPPAITPAPAQVCAGSAGNTASTATAASYSWSITNGTITGGGSSPVVTYTAGASGTVQLMLLVTQLNGCVRTSSANVSINPAPATPSASNGGPYCIGNTIQLNTPAVGGATYSWTGPGGFTSPLQNPTRTNAALVDAGAYSVTITVSGCTSAAGTTNVVMNQATGPTINAGGPTTFCEGGSVTLTSSSGTGNQWSRNGTPINGATNATYSATTSGSYTVVATVGCASAPSAATVVTVNAIPAAPSITPGGSTTFCEGGSVTLTSSIGAGNQWYRNGLALGGQTGTATIAATSGFYTVTTTANGCPSPQSSYVFVTVNPKPDATITVPSTMFSGASAAATVNASCTNATFAWSVTGGTITAGQNTKRITFTAGGAGTLTINLTVTNEFGCTDSKSANVTVQLASFGAPPFLRATATGTTSTTLIWAPVATADHYEIHRGTDGVNFASIGTTGGTTFSQSGLTPSTTYFYKIRAVKADTTASAFSAIDPMTTFVFSDDPLSACPTPVRALHITQLRTAVNLVRAGVALPAFSFTDPTLTTSSTIRGFHVNELRTALGAALSVIGVTPAYTDPTLTVGTTPAKAIHLIELRDLVR